MRKLRNIPLIVIIVASMVLGFSTLTRGHDWGDDWAWYVMQARSLLQGTTKEFMEISEFTNTRSTTHVGPLAYPWGYPLILTPALILKGVHSLTLKLPGLFFYAAFLVCLYLFARTRLARIESLLLASLFAFNPMLILFEDQILSDIPFLFFSTLTLALMTWSGKRGVFQCALIGLSIFLTAFIRTTGVLLLGVFLIVEFFRFWNNRKDRNAMREIFLGSLVICVTFAVFWGLNLLLLPSGGESYLSQYAGTSLGLARGYASGYFRVFGFFFGEAEGWKYIYYIAVVFFLLGTWVRRKDEPIFILFFVLWMIVHVTYPYWQGPRYLFPLLPIFIYFAFQGMKFALAKLPPNYQRAGQAVFNAFWLVIIGGFLFQSGVNAYINLRDNRAIGGPFDPFSREMYDYVKQNTSPDSVIIFFKPRAFYLFTERKSIMALECERLPFADYVAVNKTWEYSQIPPDLVDECPTPVVPLFENARYVVYEIQK